MLLRKRWDNNDNVRETNKTYYIAIIFTNSLLNRVTRQSDTRRIRTIKEENDKFDNNRRI